MQQTSMKTTLQFKGQWRSYQKRVLDRADNYLEDKKIHIVAAPGSGKTTLGIELIRRLNAPALVLSPSVNIRNQWLARIEEAFLPEGASTEGLLSGSIKTPGQITAITYQALHSCMRKKADIEAETSEDSMTEQGNTAAKSGSMVGIESQEQNYRDFDFFATIKKAGIKTLCLDEAHHLCSEWWRALEELVRKVPELTIISLTATPPYDSTKTEWERYIGLCGPIDEEIIVPELVKEKSLCPHQDYVYFNMPTEEETQAVIKFRQDAVAVGEQIFMDNQFARMVATHAGIQNPGQYEEQLLERPQYFSSILVFLNAKKLPFSEELVRMLGEKKKLPGMSLQWLEILLQGFLFEDTESYESTEEYREQIKELLKAHGLIQKKKVCLTTSEEVNKLLTTSKGKMKSIVTIVGEEYRNLGADLRLLILTDYIKKEYMSALGDATKAVNELGVVPIFENIRREYANEELRLAALSGSIVLIPEAAKPVLEGIITEKGVKYSIRECGAAGLCWQCG